MHYMHGKFKYNYSCYNCNTACYKRLQEFQVNRLLVCNNYGAFLARKMVNFVLPSTWHTTSIITKLLEEEGNTKTSRAGVTKFIKKF